MYKVDKNTFYTLHCTKQWTSFHNICRCVQINELQYWKRSNKGYTIRANLKWLINFGFMLWIIYIEAHRSDIWTFWTFQIIFLSLKTNKYMYSEWPFSWTSHPLECNVPSRDGNHHTNDGNKTHKKPEL